MVTFAIFLLAGSDLVAGSYHDNHDDHDRLVFLVREDMQAPGYSPLTKQPTYY